jgi:hypothetical protein
MEKTITINPTNTSISNKNNTKKKDDLQKKADINAIMEKYNLKVPKKSKLNDNKTDYVIKPKNDNQIINIVKEVPKQIVKEVPKQIVKEVPKQIVKEVPQQIVKEVPQQIVKEVPKQIIKEVPKQIIKEIPQQIVKQNISIQSIINKDKQIKENKKLEMPKAIISNTKIHPKDFMSSSNIYNLIPKINPTKQYSHLQNKVNPEIKKHINNNTNINRNIVLNENPNKNPNQNIFKKISINPNLSEDASQNYKGELQNNQNNKTKPLLQQSNLSSQQSKPSSQQSKPSSQQSKPSSQQSKPSSQQIKQIYTSPKTNLMYEKNKNQNQNKNQELQPNIESISPELSELELRRKTLQEQQYKELEKLKYKKEQIQKINNRKKEIDLIKSIDIEKQKLRIIQNKQNELNDIYNNQIKQNNIQNNIQNNNTQTLKHIIYNVDAKKTKKNIEQYKDVVNVPKVSKVSKVSNETNIPVVPIVPINIDLIKFDSNEIKTNNIEKPKIIDKSNKKQLLQESETVKKPTGIFKNNSKNNSLQIENNKSLDSLESFEPLQLKYYKKKDVPDLKWASKEELYNTDTFTENLNISLNIQPIFNNKKIIKDKFTLEEKKQILKNTYNFKNIINNNIKDDALNVIYKILAYDKINIY